MEKKDQTGKVKTGDVADIGADLMSELSEIKKLRKARRKRTTWPKSELQKFIAELLQLRANGFSYEDLAVWLEKKRSVKIDRSNVWRFLNKLESKKLEGHNG